MKNSTSTALIGLVLAFSGLLSANSQANKAPFDDKFRQMEQLLPSPNIYRTASGAPGHKYWQQKVDYDIAITLDDKTQRLTGAQTMDYQNNSPDTLRYLWLQLDQNRMKCDSAYKATNTAPSNKKVTFKNFRAMVAAPAFDGDYQTTKVSASNGKALPYIINGTMMRIDLPKLLKSGASVEININWHYQLHEQKVLVVVQIMNTLKKMITTFMKLLVDSLELQLITIQWAGKINNF